MTQNEDWIVFFDLLCLIALKYYAETNPNYVVLETGIGGRYDSTNIFNEVAVSVITRIGYDHQAMLGNTIEEIAWQKAGIIKPNGIVFTPATQLKTVLEVFRKECSEKNATLVEVPVGRDHLPNIGLTYSYPVQIENICLAAAVLEYLHIPVSGMLNFYWPCRMESFTLSRTDVQKSTRRVECIIDGCHNGESVNLFLTGIRAIEKYKDALIFVIFGAGMDKCVEDMMKELQYLPDHLLFVQSNHFRAMTEVDLLDEFQKLSAAKSSPVKIITQLGPPQGKVEGGTLIQRMQNLIDHARYEAIPILSYHFVDCVKCAASDEFSEFYTSLAGTEDKNIVLAVCGSLFAAAEAREILFRL